MATCMFFNIVSFSQTTTSIGAYTEVPEKVYLQLTSKEYTSGQTIWFKALVTDSRDHTPSYLSGVLYVDLIDPNGQIVSHKIIKLTSGIGHGFIDLPESYNGQFLIRAYTQWNRNFGKEFMFKEYITIHELIKQKEENPFGQLRRVQNEEGKVFLSGEIELKETVKTNPGKIKVKLDWGARKDSIWVKRNKGNTYFFKHEIPKELNWISLALDTDERFNYSKTVVLKDDVLDLQFFPESGKMVHGLYSKVGYKAVGFDGKGRKIQGDVFDNKGRKITSFKSNSLGMGIFHLKADSNLRFHVKINSEKTSTAKTLFPLPKAVQKGSVLSIEKTKDKIRLRVISNDLKDSVSVKISCRAVDYYLIEGMLVQGSLISKIPIENLPNGILVFTLMDKKQQPIAERLFYNESGKDELQVELITNKSNYNRREKTKLDIQALEEGKKPSIANMSIKVINKNQWREGIDGFIRSHFLLESELRGQIENPGQYFDKENPGRHGDMDALLLTQGWRNYKYPPKRQGNRFFWPQPRLTVRGVVAPLSSKNKIQKEIDLTLATFGKETSLYSQRTDSLGNFQFLLDDTYGEQIRILLHANNGKKRRKKLSIKINDFFPIEVNYKHNPFAGKMDEMTTTLLKEEQRRKRTDMVFDSLYGVTQLDEVVVEDVRLNPERRELYEKYGKPDVIISGDSLRHKEKKWSYGLYSILLFNYGSEVIIERFPDGFMLAQIPGGPSLVMVDGRLIQKYEYNYVPHMPPGVVENLELIKFAKSFKESYLQVFPETHPMELPAAGHIISINTKGKVGLYSSDKPKPGTLDTTIEVFSPIKEFYTPKYDKPIPVNEQKPDLRSLIHWKPSLNTDEKGKTSESFYNGDVLGDYVIIIEAISKEGYIGYQTKTFSVVE
ncbi:hypothetical protein [Flagellimonas pacifica]|nr:hypothetical protein [Allomuricauda parva]